MNSDYPFTIQSIGINDFIIMVPLNDEDNYSKYYDLFSQYGYESNGPCWEGHIEQILESIDPQLLKQIDFDSEASTFYIKINSPRAKDRFIQKLVPIFNNLVELENWIKNADRDRIDD
ncbi:Imm51 family immunity protein [Pedobacter nutrimenti]|uniref:Imm51 family immunity protein n=1 Tax=Pedobacter nutrimenti TaxID=1241337 RepID=UPI002931EEED|nr:Imm51 family immunity protein [Pedobacter nutrimenti]